MMSSRWPCLLSLACGTVLLLSTLPSVAAPAKSRKLMITPAPGETAADLQAAGAQKVRDYGAYWVVEADASQAEALQKQFGTRAQKADYLNVIDLAACPIDTTAAEPPVPQRLRAAAAAEHQNRLRLIQFAGPVLPEWLDQVKATGKVKVLSYIPNNAYVVRLNGAAEEKLRELLEPTGPIQWIGDYHPYYKIGRSLTDIDTDTVDIRVAVADNAAESAQTIALISSLALESLVDPIRLRDQVNLEVRVLAADVERIAQLTDVLWMTRVMSRTRHDGIQALVVSQPDSGPGPSSYLDWLSAEIGFQSGWPYPILDIADSGLDQPDPVYGLYPWHPSFWSYPFPMSPGGQCGNPGPFNYPRVAYPQPGQFNDLDGHGTLVASVAAGIEYLPNEIINCWTENNFVITETNIIERFVTNSITYDCNPTTCPTAPAVCCPVYEIIRILETNIVETEVCEPVFNDEPNPPTNWPLNLRRSSTFGQGISPFGFIGASPGGAEDSFPGPATHALRVYLSGARISNNSWGEVLLVGNNDGVYSAFSQDYDILTRDAVGTGSTNPPTPGPAPANQELFYVFSGGNANYASGGGGFGDVLVTPPATAKNVLTVGASTLFRSIASFSSFGPTEDGRIKPEILAPGEGIYGAKSQAAYLHPMCGGCNPNNPSPPACADGFQLYDIVTILYGDDPCTPFNCPPVTSYSGTSFSAPAVSGASQLLWAWFMVRLQMLPPSPAMMKAYLCNAARYLPIPNPLTGVPDRLPSPAQGMGELDLNRMFDSLPRVIRDQTTQRAIDPPLITTNPVPQQTFFSRSGQSYELSGQVYDATKPFRVTLAWTDAPGNPAAFKQLVNDLDLEVRVNGQTYRGNVFEREFSTSDPGRPFDDLNNLESVFLPAGTTGQWSLVVIAQNIAESASVNTDVNPNQDFVLVVYNGNAASDVPSLANNDTCQNAASLTQFPTNLTATLTAPNYHNNHPSPSASRGGIDAFWKIARPTIGTSFSIDTFGSDFDTVLSVWRGRCGQLIEEVSNNNFAPGNFQSAVTFVANGADDYYIVVEPHNRGPGGNLLLNVDASLPAVQLYPSSVDFGDVILGTTSTVRSVTLSNNATVAIYISDVDITGDNPGDFLLFSDDCSGSTIQPGGSCVMYLKFVPQAEGARGALLRVTDDATGSPRLIPLTGNALAPAPLVCLNRSGTMVFSNTPVGETTGPLSVVVTNCGTAPLTITNIVFTGTASNDFAATGSCLGVPVAPGGTCTINVTFTPAAAGTRQAVLQLDSNANDSPATLVVRGTGYVPAAAVCLNRTSVNFGNVTVTAVSAPQSVVVSNCGTAPLSITGVSLGGANPGDFEITSDGCTGGLIATGATCTVSVRFVPTTGGERTATLLIANTAAGSPHSVLLSGGGIASQPDALIGKSPKFKKLIGAGIINGDASGQTYTLKVKKGKTKRFYIAVRNGGSVADSFRTLGEGNGGGFTVRYFLGAKSDLDVTPAVLAGTFNTSTLATDAITGDATMIRVEVTADPLVAPGSERTFLIQFSSSLDPGKQDTVGARVYVK